MPDIQYYDWSAKTNTMTTDRNGEWCQRDDMEKVLAILAAVEAELDGVKLAHKNQYDLLKITENHLKDCTTRRRAAEAESKFWEDGYTGSHDAMQKVIAERAAALDRAEKAEKRVEALEAARLDQRRAHADHAVVLPAQGP